MEIHIVECTNCIIGHLKPQTIWNQSLSTITSKFANQSASLQPVNVNS